LADRGNFWLIKGRQPQMKLASGCSCQPPGSSGPAELARRLTVVTNGLPRRRLRSAGGRVAAGRLARMPPPAAALEAPLTWAREPRLEATSVSNQRTARASKACSMQRRFPDQAKRASRPRGVPGAFQVGRRPTALCISEAVARRFRSRTRWRYSRRSAPDTCCRTGESATVR